MDFYDKNGTLLSIGDKIVPNAGRVLKLVYSAYIPELEQECLFGYQVEDPAAISYLTQENLSMQWTKKED